MLNVCMIDLSFCVTKSKPRGKGRQMEDDMRPSGLPFVPQLVFHVVCPLWRIWVARVYGDTLGFLDLGIYKVFFFVLNEG